MTSISFKNRLDKEKIFLAAIAAIYFFALLKYYLIDYNVPDFRLYFSMALQGAKAKDGFSSLFIWIASFAASSPRALILCCLVLMSLSLVNISFFIYGLLKENKLLRWMSIFLLYSGGCFYYVYGKLFYDFPFTAFTFSLCLLTLLKIYTRLEKKEPLRQEWLILCLLLGFCFSWKPYNIFCVAGLGCLLLTKKESRILLTRYFKSFRKVISSLACFGGGYLAGNFNFLLYPRETLVGIRAYPAQYDIGLFFTGKGRYIWDHINDLPFNVSTLTITTVFLLMFLLPLLCKRWDFLFISSFIWICFLVYIRYFSPGYTWHGFVMGVFFDVYTVFLFSECPKISGWRVGKIIIIIALFIQSTTCFTYYLPLQDHWHNKTIEAVNVLEKNESEIFENVSSMIDRIKDENYAVDVALKRYKPVGVRPAAWTSLNADSIYRAATNYEFLDPLQATNYMEWDPLAKGGRYAYDGTNADYVLWIVPDAMKNIGDVVNLHKYDAYKRIDFVHKNGYSIYLLKR